MLFVICAKPLRAEDHASQEKHASATGCAGADPQARINSGCGFCFFQLKKIKQSKKTKREQT